MTELNNNSGPTNKTLIVRTVLIVAIVTALPLLIKSHYLLTILVIIGIYTLATVGLNLLIGYTGQISFGHAGFYGLGAYASAILTTQTGISPWLAMAAGAAVAGVAAILIGIPTLKLKGHFLALGTLGFASIINIVLVEGGNFTGGPNGIPGIPYLAIGPIIFDNDSSYYYLTWSFVFIGFWLSTNLVKSRTGRALRAIKGSETAAQSLGINVARRKLQVFVLSAVYAGVAGSLWAHYVTFVSPSNFDTMMTIQFVVMAVTGGIESIWGSLVGVTVLTGLTEVLRGVVPVLMPQAGGEVQIVVYGLILIMVLIFMPEGIVAAIHKLTRRNRKKETTSFAERASVPGE